MSSLFNVEAEAELLGALMAGHAGVDAIADVLKPEDFYEPTHARIFEVVCHQGVAGKPVSPIAVKGFMDGDEGLERLGGPAYLARLTGQAFGIAATQNAKMLKELALRRRMAAGLSMAVTDCADLTLTTAEIVATADEAISMQAGELVNQLSGSECFDELFATYAEGNSGVTCGCIPSVDDLLGPMKPKQLIILAARPGMGKTAMALSYTLGAAQNGYGVLYVSLEMSAGELAGRMGADLCFGRSSPAVPYGHIVKGNLSRPQMDELAKAAHFMKQLPIEVIDVGSLNVGRLAMLIRRHARRMEANGQRLDLVVVDYLQLLSADSKGRSNYEAVSEISRALKAMAKDNGVAIMALAQLSREVEKRPDKRPQLSDLRDSGQIEQDADAVLFLVRQEYYLRNTPAEPGGEADWQRAMDQVQGKIEFVLAKRRNGETGQAVGQFHGIYQAVRG